MKPLLSSISYLLLACSLLLGLQAQAYSHDERSAAIATDIVRAMGGRENYDNTRYLSWNFFGKRFHIWDKYTGDIRVDFGEELSETLIMNLHSKEGRWWQSGVEVIDKEKLKEKLNWAYRIWTNDSYWLVMPFKLHDPGVNLTYNREDKTDDSRQADVITMTFNEVGVTPENKYELFVDKESKLITEWAYYPTAEDDTPRFRMPWTNYQTFGEILLSDGRGNNSLAPVNVYKSIGENVMSSNTPAVDDTGKAIPR